MLNHSLLLEIAHERQQELLWRAETERLYKQLTGNRTALLQRVVHCLLAVAWQLTVHPQSNPATAIFGEK